MFFCLGRPLSSDQNFIGVAGGDVVRARALIRLIPSARWDSERIMGVRTTPLTEHSRFMDTIEEKTSPQVSLMLLMLGLPTGSSLREPMLAGASASCSKSCRPTDSLIIVPNVSFTESVSIDAPDFMITQRMAKR